MIIKRFTLIKNTGTDECYSDNLYDNGVYIGAICGGSEMICYLLNHLHEENIQYKQELDNIYLLIGRGDWSGLMDLLINDEKCKTKSVKSIK